MASTSNPTAKVVEPGVAEWNDEQSRLIAERLRQTRRYVKLIDLCTGTVTLVGGILGYLLIVALIDHWLIDLSPAMRLVLLLGLLVGVAGFFVWRLLPPLLHAVNPVYAAQTIEQAAPALKNSLINLVLLARQRNGVAPVIYEGLRRETAGQLAHVPPETMVDRGPLIVAGYWLVGLLAIAAAYIVFSPKDPVQSVARLAAPWSDIERPARVKILEVQPGNSSVYRGQTLDVTARIDGLKEDETATILYSSQDEQFIDQPISMRSDGTQRFRGTLSPGPRGIQQTLRYRIAAGDAQSREFVLQVKNAPHIEVRRTVYQFPRYTQLPDRVTEGQGELSALEGTRVQIEAEANQPLASAQLELFADASTADSPDAQPTRAIPMKTEGNRAVGQLTLLLQPDRRTPQAAAYQIRVTTDDGERNVQPARYRIDVTPDLVPDVEWLQPRAADMELPENSSATLEVRAFDPDFAVEQIQVVGAVGGLNRLSEELLEQPQSGQVVRKFQLVPQRLGLQAGDTLIYWAEARDNRQSSAGTPAPNIQRTANRRIRIVAPVARPQPDPGQEGAQDAADDSQAAGAQGSESDQQGGAEGQEGEAGQQGEPGGTGEEGQQEGDQRGGGQGASGADGADSGSEGTETRAEGTENGAEGTASGSEAAGEGEAASAERQDGSRDGRGDARQDAPPDGAEAGGPQADAGASAGDAGESEARAEPRTDGQADASPAGEAGSQRGQRRPSDGGGETGERPREGGNETTTSNGRGEQASDDEISAVDESQPVAPDGSNDSEAFERILRHAREQREAASERREGGESQAPPAGSPPNAGDADSGTPSPDQPTQDAPPETTDGERRTPEERAERDSAGDRGAANRAAEPASEQAGARSGDEAEAGEEPTPGDEPTADPSGRGSPSGETTRSDQTRADQTRADQAGEGEASSDDNVPPDADRQSDRDAQADGRSDGARDVPPRAARSDPAGESESGESSAAPPSSSADGTNGSPAEEGSGERPASSGQSASEGPGQATRSPGGGQAEGASAEGAVDAEATSAADEANLEYARRATDLALRHLKDDRHGAELQERLGWTREEMEAFLRRWEQMQRAARQSGQQGEQARRRLSDQLRGLGLQPQAERVRGSQTRKDDLRSLRQSSNVPIPAEYLEQYRAFLKSVPSQEPSRSPSPQK